ncbi:ATP-binding protein [Mumia sp. DW29H23]|uniref:ATP-binding protein n=1 Tax=Mumia sp. DW29H23 TaxID=3421241 RepID=UPI003D680930
MRLLERSSALAEMRTAYDDLQRGHGSVALIQGEAGIGKTSLVRCFLAQTVDPEGHPDRRGSSRAARHDVRVLVGSSDDLVVPRPLGAVLELADDAPSLGRALADGVDAPSAVLATVREEPTVCVLEDVHWADEATLDVITVLARRIEELPLLLVLTFRDDEVAADHPLRRALAAIPPSRAHRLLLAPLSVEAVGRLTGAPTDADAVHALTGGNPFFVTEIVSGGPGRVPASVRDAVLGRFARVSTAGRATAELVSVVPGRAEGWLVEACLGADADVAEGERHGLLVADDGTVRFQHELARWAVEAELGGQRRRDLNRLVLQQLAAHGASHARLAHHAWMAGDADAVLRHGIAAGEQAAGARSHRESVELLARALQHGDLLPPRARADALDLLSSEAYLAGQAEHAVSAREEAVRVRAGIGDPLRSSESLRWLSRIRWWAGDRPGAERAGREAMDALDGLPDSREHTLALTNLSQLAMLAQRDEEAVAFGERALAIGSAHGDHEVVVHARINIGTTVARTDLEGGVATLREAADAASDHGIPHEACRGLVNAAWLLKDERQYARAREIMDDALVVARENELSNFADYLYAMRALVDLATGDWDAAAADVAQVETPLVPSLEAEALLAIRRGDPEADELLDRAWARASSSAELQRLRPVACARAEAAWLAGDHRGVEEATAATYALGLELGTPWDVGELAVWRFRAGLLERPPDGCSTPFRLEIAGDPRGAALAWKELGEPYSQALALVSAGDEAALREAAELLDGLGGVAALRLVRARLRALGVTSAPRGRRPSTRSNPSGLTDRQLEVLSLIVAGASNTAIAQQLVVSPKTVEHHVSAVLAKLGVTTRGEAAEEARRLGVGDRERGGVGGRT